MKQLYAIFDKKSESYGPLMGVAHEAIAVREFGSACDSSDSFLSKYPEDFELHYLGDFSDVRGDCEGTNVKPVVGAAPMVVISATAWIASGGVVSQVPRAVKS